jgi:CheY-like chemotaxis protein
MSRSSTRPTRMPSRPNGSAESPPATILVVDTSAWILGMFTALLERLGYRIATATTGAEALTAVIGQRPAAIIVDIQLPDMAVGELAREIRRVTSAPILLMTGGDDELNSRALASVPSAATLTKPFGIAEVQDALRACVATLPAVTHAARPGGGAAGALPVPAGAWERGQCVRAADERRPARRLPGGRGTDAGSRAGTAGAAAAHAC